MLIEGGSLDVPAAPLHELLASGLAAAPDDAALVSAERRISWRELEAASTVLAGGYLGLGLEAGDRVASLMPNRIGLAITTSPVSRPAWSRRRSTTDTRSVRSTTRSR